MDGVLEELELDPIPRLLYKQYYAHVHFQHYGVLSNSGGASITLLNPTSQIPLLNNSYFSMVFFKPPLHPDA